MKKAMTVYDIAKEAGVSPSTVSRVLTGNAKVSREKAEKVRAIIKKNNFKPNAIARSLITRESRMIGVILPDITNPFFASVFLEAESYAMSLGYSLLLCNSMGKADIESMYLKILVEKKVDGIIMAGGRVNETKTIKEHADEVIEVMEQVPFVIVNGKMAGVDSYRVYTDEARGVEQLVDYLYRLGHRRIGFIGGVKGITSMDVKLKTFLDSAREYGILCKKEWIVPGSFSVESGIESMNELLSNRDLPTAVMSVNDFTALGALKAATKRGFVVPDDISITGFDDIYLTDIMTPAITTVSQNMAQIGRTAVDVVVNLANGNKVKKNQCIRTSLVIKDSCAANNSMS